MGAQARCMNASWISGSRSQRMRRRRKQCSQAKVRSTTRAVAAEAGAVLGLAPGDHRRDPSLPDEATVRVVVVAAVGDEAVGSPPRPTDTAAYRGEETPFTWLQRLGCNPN